MSPCLFRHSVGGGGGLHIAFQQQLKSTAISLPTDGNIPEFGELEKTELRYK
jgi:hypothetical protein